MNFTDNGVSAKDVTLLYAIQEAYGVYDYLLWANVPKWIEEKRFDIEAKYNVEKYPHPTLEQRRAMLQQLLAERFQLSIHHEQKDFPVYALEIAKSGPKFTDTKPDDQIKSATYGTMCLFVRSKPGILEMKGCSIQQFADAITGFTRRDLGRKVVDRTGLSGHYNFTLSWSQEAPHEPNALDTEAGPTIFTALREQLGLTLKSDKAPLDTILIDHVEMPTEN